MKIAIVYNRESNKVINLFGTANKEKIGLKTIHRLADALQKGGHTVRAFEGDKDLVDKLEEFMPRVVKGERPGMVFNVSYGIQGQARYTHVPSILEMVGIPYVASGPLAHSLALDKVVTKMILRQHNIATPDFAVLQSPDTPCPELQYPLIVKPKNESVSFGIRIVTNDEELREGAANIFEHFNQAVLVEQYIEGREINVGIIGNHPPEVFEPVELLFGDEGPKIYTYEDKRHSSGRTISHACPADITPEQRQEAMRLAVESFTALGCYDCVRVDMRMDDEGQLYVLEVNSLPSLGEHGSYLIGAAHAGLDFAATANRLVDVAAARYFGTPQPPELTTPSQAHANERCIQFITNRRDKMEDRLSKWTNIASRSDDPIGIQEAVRELGHTLTDLGLRPNTEMTDGTASWIWETKAGMKNGVLFVGHLDIPSDSSTSPQMFHREAEWIYGDGIASSRAPLVMLEYALRSLKAARILSKRPIGVLYYTDEGRDARYSSERIREAASQAKQVLVLRPGNVGDKVITQRRGQRKYRFRVEGEPLRPGKISRRPEALRWAWEMLEALSRLTNAKQRVSVSTVDLHTVGQGMLLPHRVIATILMTYPETAVAEEFEKMMFDTFGKRGPKWELKRVSERPPMKERRTTLRLANSYGKAAAEWDIELKKESSLWPSIAGLVPAKVPCLCGIGPVGRDLSTLNEAVERISLIQRTLVLTQFLANLKE